ncbi:MAG TPA: hypothetical protein VFT66_00430 [Roseiflexaceae bacterium]|jgi:hypothetical protein|nr:hypothetical protein [Roseiflexaceae bacterium]
MLSSTILITLLIAAIGWLATIRVISTSRLHRIKKRTLLIPSWVLWLVVALGAPILSGVLPVADALNIGGALTAGVVVSMAFSSWR